MLLVINILNIHNLSIANIHMHNFYAIFAKHSISFRVLSSSSSRATKVVPFVAYKTSLPPRNTWVIGYVLPFLSAIYISILLSFWLSGNIWLVSFKISYLCLPLFYETRTTPSCHPSGCAYRQL